MLFIQVELSKKDYSKMKLNWYLLLLLIGIIGYISIPEIDFPKGGRDNPVKWNQYDFSRRGQTVSAYFMGAGVILGCAKMIADAFTTKRSDL